MVTRPRAGMAPATEIKGTPTALQCDPVLSFEAWKALGAKIGVYSSAAAWWLGDWLAFGQSRYGPRYREGIALTGLTYQTLRNYTVVARRFEPDRRRAELTFQHHAEVCALEDDDQDFWLDLAVEMGWSKAELRRRVRNARAGRGAPRSAMGVLHLALEPQREQRWREAARAIDCDFEEWVTIALDEAAAAALEPAEDDDGGPWVPRIATG